MKIGRTLYWFNDGNEQLLSLTYDFFGLGHLLNRLLNDRYDGKKIKFINLYFYTDETYKLLRQTQKCTPYYYGGHLKYFGFFDKNQFLSLGRKEQENFVWEKAHRYLLEAAAMMKNTQLAEAAEYAYKKGLEIELNTDLPVLETDLTVFGKNIKACVWIIFKEDSMYSKFVLEQDGNVIFSRDLDRTELGIEVFLDMYKKIVIAKDAIVIKVMSNVSGVKPIKIPFSEIAFLDN